MAPRDSNPFLGDIMRAEYESRMKGPPWWVIAVVVTLAALAVYASTLPASPPPPCRGQLIHFTDGTRSYSGCIETPRVIR